MSPKILLVAAAALTVSGAAAVPAAAQTPPPSPPAQAQPGKMPLRATVMFNLVDRNGDGAIDKDELDVVRNAIFAAVDTNSDGKLTKDEVQAIGQGMRDRARARFQQRPHFGWQGGPPRDWRGPMQRPQGPRQGMLDDRQGPPPAGMTGQTDTPDQGRLAGPQGLAATDQNGDGTITRDEFAVGMLPGMAELFAR